MIFIFVKEKITVSRRRIFLIFFCFAALIFLRFCFAGFSYPYQLDDYIQYHNYATTEDYGALIREQGLFASRPLAILLDLYVFSPLWDHMILGVLLISLLYAAALLLLWQVFRRLFGTGWFFPVFCGLLPLGMEGTYWISASSRIVCGLFFTAVAAVLLLRYADRGGFWRGGLFFLILLLSFSVYEQILVLSALLMLILGICLLWRKQKRGLIALLAFPAAGCYFLFCRLFGGEGALSSRMSICLPQTPWFWEVQLPDAARQIGAAFLKGGYRTLCRGFLRAWEEILARGAFWYPLVMLILCYFMCRLFRVRKDHSGDNISTPVTSSLPGWIAPAAGFLLAFFPAVMFVFIGNPWFSLRCTVACYPGIALALDCLARWITGKHRRLYPILTSLLAFWFVIAGASEVADYQRNYAEDVALLEALEPLMAEEGRIGLLSMNQVTLEEQNYAYHEHITSIGSSDWALQGALTAYYNRSPAGSLIPLDTAIFPYYHGWNESAKRPEGFDRLYLWNAEERTLTPLTLRIDNVWEDNAKGGFYDPEGVLRATYLREDGYGYVVPMVP